MEMGNVGRDLYKFSAYGSASVEALEHNLSIARSWRAMVHLLREAA
jgi:hypothetical protein